MLITRSGGSHLTQNWADLTLSVGACTPFWIWGVEYLYCFLAKEKKQKKKQNPKKQKKKEEGLPIHIAEML